MIYVFAPKSPKGDFYAVWTVIYFVWTVIFGINEIFGINSNLRGLANLEGLIRTAETTERH
jgi:hypothetical protein